MGPEMLLRLLTRSLWHRRGRTATGFLAMAVGGGLAMSMIQVAADAGAKLQRELRIFGANLVLLPAGAGHAPFTASAVDRFGERLDPAQVRACSPVAEGVVYAGHRPLALVGVRWREAPALFSYWRVQGRWPAAGDVGACLLGARLATALGAAPGQPLALRGKGGKTAPRVVGILRAGDAADDQCFLSLDEAQRLLARHGGASLGLALLRGDASTVERLARQASAGVPAITAQPIRALAQAEGPLLARARWLMAAASAAVLLLAVLAMLTATMAAAIDREPELALMKALGWEDRQAAAVFLAEAALLGLLAGVAAAFLAWFGGQRLARSLFNATLTLRPSLLLLALVLGLLLALLGAALPALRVLRLEPARALRND
jgi:putative ABC transport system permease protein